MPPASGTLVTKKEPSSAISMMGKPRCPTPGTSFLPGSAK